MPVLDEPGAQPDGGIVEFLGARIPIDHPTHTNEPPGFTGGWIERVDVTTGAVTVLTAPSSRPDRRLESRLSRHFEQVTSGVVIAPWDASLVDGGPIDFEALSPETRDAWLTVAATVADRL